MSIRSQVALNELERQMGSEAKREVWVIEDASGNPLNASVWGADGLEFRPSESVRYIPDTAAGRNEAGWISVERRPLVPGERRVMAVEILRNGVPDWDVFVAAVSEEHDDEWSSEYHDPGWAPSEVSYSMSIGGLPSLPAPPSPEANGEA